MLRQWFPLVLTILAFGLAVPPGVRGEGRVVNMWPVLDYRSAPSADYAALHLFGPLLKYERKGGEREFGLRPLFHLAWDHQGEASVGEFLYPISSRKRSNGASSFQAVRLLQSDFGLKELGSDNEFMLFPFIFYGETEQDESYFALFPIGGRLLDKFGRDEIRFALFPLYGRTVRKQTTVTNILWPVFSLTRGEGEKGIKFWPIYGKSAKEGVYSSRFWLWPIFFAEDLGLDSDNPRRRRAAFPFYSEETSPQLTTRHILWPFFSYRHDRIRDYREWNAPWPLVRIMQGTGREGGRVLPFWGDEQVGSKRLRWYLWPIYRIEELQTDLVDRRRDRILYFLFSHLREEKAEGTPAQLRRTALWPLFTWEERDGVASFHTLSLLEPFFPDKPGIERNWSPLWRLYQTKSDRQGNEISSLLWNLYWKEKRGNDLAFELFPLFDYRREAGNKDIRLLKGLLRYRQNGEMRRIDLFYLPLGIDWRTAEEENEGA